jgi:hypothetical protein
MRWLLALILEQPSLVSLAAGSLILGILFYLVQTSHPVYIERRSLYHRDLRDMRHSFASAGSVDGVRGSSPYLNTRVWSRKVHAPSIYVLDIEDGRKHITKLRLPSGKVWGRRKVFARWEESQTPGGRPFPEEFRLKGTGKVHIEAIGTRE